MTCAVLDLTGSDGASAHKQYSNMVDVMSPPPSAFCLLGSEAVSTPAYAPLPPFQTELPANDGLVCGNVHKSFHWPGIDAVMESYQLYLEGNVCHCTVDVCCLCRGNIWKSYFDIISKLFQCITSHVTTSETEIKLFQPLKLFQRH